MGFLGIANLVTQFSALHRMCKHLRDALGMVSREGELPLVRNGMISTVKFT